MKGSVISLRVCLVGWILGRMEKKEWRIGEKMSGKVFGWKGRGREKWWGQQVFSLPPPSKYNLSKLEWKVRKIFEQNCPTSFNISGFFLKKKKNFLIIFFKKTLLVDFLCYFLKCPLSSMRDFFKKYNVLLFVFFKRDMMVNLYKLYFQLNQKYFHPSAFSSSQPNTNEEN